jgi:DNA-binding transcriptional LysR family regulator
MAKKRETWAPRPSIGDLVLYCQICQGLGLTRETDDTAKLKGRSFHKLCHKSGPILGLRGREVSTLSVCIKRLEKEHGQQFIVRDRSGQGNTVTPAGRQFFRLALDVVEGHSRLQQPLTPPPPVVTIGAYTSLLVSHLPAALADYLTSEKRKKAERPRIRFRERTFLQLVEAVEQGEVDFGVGAVPLKRDARTVEKRITVRALKYKVERGFVCHCTHPLATRKRVTKDDLARETEFRLPGGIPTLDEWLPMGSLAGGETIEVTSFGVALACVELGLGFAVVPYLPGEISRAVERDGIHYRSLPELGYAEVATYLPAGGKSGLSPAAVAVLDEVEGYFRQRASGTPLRP